MFWSSGILHFPGVYVNITTTVGILSCEHRGLAFTPQDACNMLKSSRGCRRSNSPEQGEPSEKEVRFSVPTCVPCEECVSFWRRCCRLNHVPEEEWTRYPGPSSVFAVRHGRSELRGVYQILQGCFFPQSLKSQFTQLWNQCSGLAMGIVFGKESNRKECSQRK